MLALKHIIAKGARKYDVTVLPQHIPEAAKPLFTQDLRYTDSYPALTIQMARLAK